MKRAPSPTRRARELVRVADMGGGYGYVEVGGVRLGGASPVPYVEEEGERLRRILAREFRRVRRAALLRARTLILHETGHIDPMRQRGLEDAASIVEELAGRSRRC